MSAKLDQNTAVPALRRTASRQRARFKLRAKDLILYGLLIVLSVVYLLPLYWMISTSLKQTGSEMVIPPQWIPNPIVWSNYLDVFVQVPLTLYIRNSLLMDLHAPRSLGATFCSPFVLPR
jgi:ABC-type glycerol-3-phosphate transport system permease component